MKQLLKKQIAERLHYILKDKGLKQQDLADLSGFSKSYISLIMSGSMNVTLETISTLEQALKETLVVIPKKMK